MPDTEQISFYPKPLPEWFDGELYLRNLNKDIAVEIDDDFPGMQVLVLIDKTDNNAIH